MTINEKVFGKDAAGREIFLHTVSNGIMEISVMNYGATLVSVRTLDRNGDTGEITLGLDSLNDYMGDHPFLGSSVGRFANRIARGSFTLDGKTHTLAKNNGPNHLHGGMVGYNKVTWKHEEAETNDSLGLRYTYLSPDGEEGYPGNLAVSILFRLTKTNELIIEYEAETDKPTPVNLTNHAYWNLKGPGKSDIYDHFLTLYADSYLPVDDNLIPTGKIAPVAGTPLDFRMEKAIGRDISAAGGYDHCFVIRGRDSDLKTAAKVFEPDTGRTMTVQATQPGIQFYSGNFLNGLAGRNSGVYKKHGGFCLETEAFPDAVNQPSFPSAILMP
ncbi:MAG: galactose mutarotase, partial [Spirochaetales bacterium]